jgi:Protein ENHANCED DISEASE RESISTANCE 2, C-terminal
MSNETPEKIPLAKVKGLIVGNQTPSGKHIQSLKLVASADDDDSLPSISASESRQRLYSEDDEEIRMAKAMAMAIQSNPHMKTDELQKYIEEKFHVPKPMAAPKKVEFADATSFTASAIQGIESDSKREKKLNVSNPFMNLQESMLKTQELAKQRFQEMVQGAKAPLDNSNVQTSITEKKIPKGSINLSQTLPEEPVAPYVSIIPQQNSDVPHFTEQPIRLSNLVWKRRSGMGKYSGNNWERRKLVIRGNLVAYYKCDVDMAAADDSISDVGDIILTASTEDEEKKPSWLEQAAMNLTKSNMVSSLGIIPIDDDPTKPRGIMDVVKEKATVCASMGHSGAPTPFCLSIMVGADTKWKLSFDSHKLQMEWLAALSDLVVKSCVDVYNSHLLAASDPRPAGIKLSTTKDVWYSPPNSEAHNGTNLWTMSTYSISNMLKSQYDVNVQHERHGEETDVVAQDCVAEETLKVESTLDECNTSKVDDDNNAWSQAKGKSQTDKPQWAIRETDVYLAAAIVNCALLFSHATSTTPTRFWHIATFTNLSLFLLLYKPEIRTKDSPDSIAKDDEAAGIKSKLSSNVAQDKHFTKSIAVNEEAPDKEGAHKINVPSSFKPMAGSTTVKVVEPKDSTLIDGHTFTAWRQISPAKVMVRSHGYKTTKQKIASPGCLYDCVHMDVFESPLQYLDISKQVILPEVKFDDVGPKTWKSPDRFTVLLSIPIEAPASVFAPSSDDGRGFAICMYFVMRQDTRDILRRITADDYDPAKDKISDIQSSKKNAVKLFEHWCRRAPTDPEFQARFKFIANIANIKEAGLPGWMQGYLGKPMLIKRKNKTGFLFSHPDMSAMEFDISLHPFPYIAKQAFSYLYQQNIIKNLMVSCGYVIESREDDELPECLIGLAELCYPNPLQFMQGSDLFAGKTPKSQGKAQE